MAFIVPTMNLLASIWKSSTWRSTYPPTVPAADYTGVTCQLRPSTRQGFSFESNFSYPTFEELIVPKGTDLQWPGYNTARNEIDAVKAIVVEVPQGTGRYYFVWAVFDVAKGFTNEYRVGLIQPSAVFNDTYFDTHFGGPYAPHWPTPYP